MSTWDIISEIAAEGAVLLENNGILPLAPEQRKIALFGAGAVDTLKGGTGSGDVVLEHVVNIEEALLDVGFEITSGEWLADYKVKSRQAEEERYRAMHEDHAATGDPQMSVFLRHNQVLPSGAPIEMADHKNEIAVYCISRQSGECGDRNTAEGDYYLRPEETEHLRVLGQSYGEVIVLLNTGAAVDTSFFREIPGLSALLIISQAGICCGTLAADLLTGRSVPSGKLTATWAMRYEDYPAAASFRDNSSDDKYYTEGIYVGYRHFDARKIRPAYPFGYGLGYTEFSWETISCTVEQEQVQLQVRVANTGDRYSGREVLQVYTSSPAGKLDHPVKELRAFEKTQLLKPGEEELLTLTFPLSQMASYDEESAAWILEAGQYAVLLGNSSANTIPVHYIQISETRITEQLTNRMTESAAKTASSEEKLPSKEALENISWVRELTRQQLAAIVTGVGAIGNAAVIGSASISVPGASGETSPCIEKTHGLHSLIFADGPAGLRLMRSYRIREDGSVVVPKTGFLSLTGYDRFVGVEPPAPGTTEVLQQTTAIPIGSMLAQTWNPQAAKKAGKIVASEMKQYGVHVWLAPAVNIQRDPLCGRNFEYYSEDPLLAGKIASAVVQGIQSVPGCGVAVKHMAANSQEDNRFDENSIVSERALREIYLKNFEIAVKESQPTFIMSSYNLINGVHAANNWDLLTGILRKEWGFRGAVVTDWGTTRNGMRAGFGGKTRSQPDGCIFAGNDLIMPGDRRDQEEILEAVENGQLSLEALQAAAAHVISVCQRLGVCEKV